MRFNFSQPAPEIAVAVVVATKNRTRLLSERALLSVTVQTKVPQFLIVVDDSIPNYRTANRKVVEAVPLFGCVVVYLENARTTGASGSWNTAIDFLMENATSQNLFVAILDDDDAWRPTYLERCAADALHRNLDIFAADLLRIEHAEHIPTVVEAPNVLCAEACLVGNPGIQGSNLFVRLDVLIAAGGFDEALRSCTDRDLCIRIADLSWVRYGRIPEVLVEHYADVDRDRLSSRGSAAKQEGLTAFWFKHVGRMRTEQRIAFATRAADVFGWTAPEPPVFPVMAPAHTPKRLTLVLGLVASHNRPTELLEIVRQLAGYRNDADIRLEVLLFEQGIRRDNAFDLLATAASLLRDAGFGCFCFTQELQHAAGAHASIAICCEVVVRSRADVQVWLADTRPCVKSFKDTGIWNILNRLGAVQWLGPSPSHPTVADSALFLRWLASQRAVTAEHRLRRRYLLGELRILGSGSESVVFTDGRLVYKCIDHWKHRIPRAQLNFLKRQVGRWLGAACLYTLHEVVEEGPMVVIIYDFEESHPYRGGLDQELVALMNSCRTVGIVCNNIHPKNLVVTASGMKLIDYGSDIRAWNPLGFEHMARRAYLASHYAEHPDLSARMRRSLIKMDSADFAGYMAFRSRLADAPPQTEHVNNDASSLPIVACAHMSLYVGVITADPRNLAPLLQDLHVLAKGSELVRLATVVLDNASPSAELEHVVRAVRDSGLNIAVVSVNQQRQDAVAGAFGDPLRDRPSTPVGIAAARTMLQRYLGALMEQDAGSVAWILDDDMRVDARAHKYLQWLPAFRDAGVDVLIGAYEGSSPNPPLNGLRVQLVDIFHNYLWLQGLCNEAVLPNRSAENAALRARFPDYYYDLSRHHTAHLEQPLWLEPIVKGETVAEARNRLLAGALGVLSGQPLTRAIVSPIPTNPIASAKKSVNRGGNTFIFNHRALTQTPNTIVEIQGREARRSDMIWAIVNQQYRRLNVKTVSFPVRHIARAVKKPHLNIEKIQGEIVGSALYAGLMEFLSKRPEHTLDFSPNDVTEILRFSAQHQNRRLRALRQSIGRIMGLCEAIRGAAYHPELLDLTGYLDLWFADNVLLKIQDGVQQSCNHEIYAFLRSLRTVADNFALTTINTQIIHAQFSAYPPNE